MTTARKWRHPFDAADQDFPHTQENLDQYSVDVHNFRLIRGDFEYPFRLGGDIPPGEHPFRLREQLRGSAGLVSTTPIPVRSQGIASLGAAHCFHGKAVVLYATTDDFSALKPYDLVYRLFPTWFDLVGVERTPAQNYGQFIFEPVAIHSEDHPKTVSGLVKTHQDLMSQLDMILAATNVDDPDAKFASSDDARHHSYYKLHPNLRDQFVILDEYDPAAGKDKALLVILSQERAEELGAYLAKDRFELQQINNQHVWSVSTGLKEIMYTLLRADGHDTSKYA